MLAPLATPVFSIIDQTVAHPLAALLVLAVGAILIAKPGRSSYRA